MRKAVMISIQPKWCEKIARGEKTIEVRKNRPKIETPFKCYIYCTASGITAAERDRNIFTDLRCKVIGEFVCDRIVETVPWRVKGKTWLLAERTEDENNLPQQSCLTIDELEKYAGGEYQCIYGWHISNLVIYDKPKELSDFSLYYCSVVWENGYPIPTHEIRRPPQSWCYVEEVQSDG